MLVVAAPHYHLNQPPVPRLHDHLPTCTQAPRASHSGNCNPSATVRLSQGNLRWGWAGLDSPLFGSVDSVRDYIKINKAVSGPNTGIHDEVDDDDGDNSISCPRSEPMPRYERPRYLGYLTYLS